MNYCDIAFMGGGVRGIAFAGAIAAFEEADFVPRNVVGTSAGAIAAALVAAGFNGSEIKKELENLDYLKFKTKDHTSGGLFSEYMHLLKDFGIYSADFFEKWLASLLKQKGIITFGDLEKYGANGTLQITAADITNKRLLVLPQDLKLFGLIPGSFSVATAVRAGMSIPIFYEPYKLKDSLGNEHIIVDGGLFCNYPIWLLDDGCSAPDVPVFGLKFVDCATTSNNSFSKFTDYIKHILGAVLDVTNRGYTQSVRGDSKRTIEISACINNKTISATNFALDKKTAAALHDNGHKAATKFLKSWNFEKWLALRK